MSAGGPTARPATAPATCRRPCRPPRRRDGGALVDRLGEAEVGEVGALAFDQDVVRLHVAVDDPGRVGGVERLGDLAEQRRRPRRRQRALAVDQPAQVAALDQAHRDDQLAVDLARVVDRDRRRVVEPRRQPRLAQEALPERGIARELAGDHLQRHRPVEAEVGGTVDDAHPATGEAGVDPVSGDFVTDGEVCHRAVIPPGGVTSTAAVPDRQPAARRDQRTGCQSMTGPIDAVPPPSP